MPKRDSQGLSITAVVSAAFLLTSFLCWGVLAASYAGGTAEETVSAADEGYEESPSRGFRRRASLTKNVVLGVTTFVSNAFQQLPHLPAVVSWHLAHRLWLLIVLCLFPPAVLLGGVGMKAVEQRLDEKPRVKRRKLATPKG